MSSNSILCRQCNQPITFDSKHISQRTGKKIPLDVETNEPHDCPLRKDQQREGISHPEQQQTQQQRRYHRCNKGCGEFIYLHGSQRTENGKWIPLSKETGEPHRCQQWCDPI
jgi:hypothetical protein